MPSTHLTLHLDADGSGLLAGGSALGGGLPVLTRNDTATVRLRLRRANSSGLYEDVDPAGLSVRLGLGELDAAPADGSFQLIMAGPVTSSAIPYNATTAQFLNAVSGVAGLVTVATYGSEGSAWIVTAATANAALFTASVTADLIPDGAVQIVTRRAHASGVTGSQIVRARRAAAVQASSFAAASTANVVTLTLVQDGSATAPTKNETYRLAVGPDAEGGSFSLFYGGNTTTALPVGATAASVQAGLRAVSGLSGGISVDAGEGGYTITFIGPLGATNVTTALALDAGGVIFARLLESTVTLAGASLDLLFNEAAAETITPTLEIEVTEGGQRRTLFQGDITLRKDLLT